MPSFTPLDRAQPRAAYITHIGKCLPGDPIANDEMEAYLGQVGDRPSRVKARILKSNGIQQRYYALDRQQQTTLSNSQMAAAAVRDALAQAELDPKTIDLLACATTWPDLLVPGFASMVHGELPELAPVEATSHQGVCCAGVAALKYAAAQVQLGQKRRAIAVASELASRLFKHTRFEAETANQAGAVLPFDTEFLRWMLSDGAGACLVSDRPSASGLSLKIEWIELVSHANSHPLCMYAGVDSPTELTSWMDFPDQGAAAAAGALNLRQNIRLLDQVVQLGVEGWIRLIEAGRVHPDQVDWLLCHYSSHFFRSQIINLLEQAGCMIPEERWFTNLYTRGNTGCASIYLMLEELFNSGKLRPGQQIFCFVPESGRFTTAYMLLTVVEATGSSQGSKAEPLTAAAAIASPDRPPSPTAALETETEPTVSETLLRQLMLVWLTFERELRSVPIVRRLHQGEFTLADYRALLRALRPQVVDGARWIARAASNMTDFELRSHLIGHAHDEHRDFQMLERDYVSVGGQLEEILEAEQNIGSEALSAFIFQRASRENPIDLLGSIFIVEGLGNRMAGQWAALIQQSLGLDKSQISFLSYHGENDEAHVKKLDAFINAGWMTAAIAARIVKTAQVTARLYRLQLEEIDL
ncbi:MULTISPECIES: 3-oxoacyl-[acyl-carrier-protein] synthase III C-terminal domain-containing protein [Cyanophyceae]|uniref:3-oxoacyl-[acyl-carrier-protein] synthase III C-terminal domain-containing protein n=1 Tax=Cyanophyceae TaxID=3028117 RepID=UPI00168529F6|nr:MULTISPECIES: 3-oxoacyl-[acyl-carrier-protein] synthase III C-terminal domain-containing protein [Cyanophyceae]MBD1917379.1 iron-containing redox enzyme family protein [Phormidium sp. FACHB-77]MBD2032376.1 iron-containing redox enzyme family protein [Phormidium sp. FACHB-322]MBD2052314.1 iron-containing redox enzyme family protein [Leptolyngbya sp. FACHB-60]